MRLWYILLILIAGCSTNKQTVYTKQTVTNESVKIINTKQYRRKAVIKQTHITESTDEIEILDDKSVIMLQPQTEKQGYNIHE